MLPAVPFAVDPLSQVGWIECSETHANQLKD
jgi:hypothetical protein